MPFPLLFVAVAFAFGIGAADALGLTAAPTAVALGAALVGAWAFYALKKNRPAFGLTLGAAFFLGATLFAADNARFDKNLLHALRPAGYADFTGVLERSPSPGIDRDYLFLRVESVWANNEEKRLAGHLRVSVLRSTESAPLHGFYAGDRVKVSAQITPPHEYRNFEEPFSRTYLKTQLLHNVAATKSPLLVEKIAPAPALSPRRTMSALRLACQTKLERFFAAPGAPGSLTPEGAVLETLLLGGRGRLAPETTQALQKTGLFHLFAISGAHIGIISFFLFGLMKFARVPSRASYGILILLLILYALLVEGRASVTRAVVMSVIFLLGKLFWKDTHLLNTIGLSALLILSVNPFQLFDAGFQLTFAATLGIILFYPRVQSFLPRLPLKISETFNVSLTAQAGVFPLIAASFHRIIFSGLLLNLIGIPLVSLTMAVGYLFLPLVFAAPVLGSPLAAVLAFLVRVFMVSTRLFDGLPFLSYRIPTPPTAVVVGYFVFLLLLLLPGRFIRLRRTSAGAFVLVFLTLILYPFRPSSRALRVTFIDVGQGDSIFIEFPGRTTMLVDGGGLPTGTFDIGESVVSPFLWNKGIKKIDYLVLTHAHPDHAAGLTAVARNFRIGEFWQTPSPTGDRSTAALHAALSAVPTKIIGAGFSRRVGEATVEALWPPPDSPPGASPDNDLSLVLRLASGPTAVLLPADIGVAVERRLVDEGAPLRAAVLKSPHHGSATSSSEEFLKAVAPEIIVVTAGAGNRFGFPQPIVLARYEASGARILRTDVSGAVEITFEGTRLAVRASEAQFANR
jgi:competence protein ComEC